MAHEYYFCTNGTSETFFDLDIDALATHTLLE